MTISISSCGSAYLLWDDDRPSQALQVVDRVLRQVPDSERGRALRAHLLSATGRYPEAAREFKSLLKKNPTEIDFKLSLAWALSRMDDLDEARRWLDRAWEPVAAVAASADAVRCAVTGARIELVAGNSLVAREWLARIADPDEVGEEYVRLLGESFRQEEDWSGGIGALMRLQPRLKDLPLLAAQAIEAEFRIRSADPRAWQRLRPLLDSDDPGLGSHRIAGAPDGGEVVGRRNVKPSRRASGFPTIATSSLSRPRRSSASSGSTRRKRSFSRSSRPIRATPTPPTTSGISGRTGRFDSMRPSS